MKSSSESKEPVVTYPENYREAAEAILNLRLDRVEAVLDYLVSIEPKRVAQETDTERKKVLEIQGKQRFQDFMCLVVAYCLTCPNTNQIRNLRFLQDYLDKHNVSVKSVLGGAADIVSAAHAQIQVKNGIGLFRHASLPTDPENFVYSHGLKLLKV